MQDYGYIALSFSLEGAGPEQGIFVMGVLGEWWICLRVLEGEFLKGLKTECIEVAEDTVYIHFRLLGIV